ncbi:MspA family porin [Gordonia shandongensis]|uniref:MspA family porin n=1 Tax=Gordonia shandongensis TaxID=376351 RepID=UPI00042007A2|nr:MspA family porin [Gordonia shandongensis]
MKKRLTTLFAVAAAAFTTVALVPSTAAAATHHTREGVTIELSTAQLSAKKIPPLDGSPLSGEARLSSNVHTALTGIEGKKVRATLEVGYQVGYPVSLAPGGVKVTAHTPDLKLTAGVNAKLKPDVTIDGTGGGGSIGEVGGELGAEATVIPSADLEFEVAAGKITTVSLAKIALVKPTADIVLSGVEMNVSNAVGPISVRPFAKISVTTDTGVYVYYSYGKTTRL